MKIINQSAEIIVCETSENICKQLEQFGRVAYKSEDKITKDSYKKFLQMILQKGHESVLEHKSISVHAITNRGITHEIVRHRIGSYTQESTRFVNYKNKEMEFIMPSFWDSLQNYKELAHWEHCMQYCENAYLKLLKLDCTPQQARGVLPNDLKTEIIITYNLRQWRHFFNLRCAKDAHPQMQELAKIILEKMYQYLPEIFQDIYEKFLRKE